MRRNMLCRRSGRLVQVRWRGQPEELALWRQFFNFGSCSSCQFAPARQ
jgi:hypothetical protein